MTTATNSPAQTTAKKRIARAEALRRLRLEIQRRGTAR